LSTESRLRVRNSRRSVVLVVLLIAQLVIPPVALGPDG
jgi:hypothetical protein